MMNKKGMIWLYNCTKSMNFDSVLGTKNWGVCLAISDNQSKEVESIP